MTNKRRDPNGEHLDITAAVPANETDAATDPHTVLCDEAERDPVVQILAGERHALVEVRQAAGPNHPWGRPAECRSMHHVRCWVTNSITRRVECLMCRPVTAPTPRKEG